MLFGVCAELSGRQGDSAGAFGLRMRLPRKSGVQQTTGGVPQPIDRTHTERIHRASSEIINGRSSLFKGEAQEDRRPNQLGATRRRRHQERSLEAAIELHSSEAEQFAATNAADKSGTRFAATSCVRPEQGFGQKIHQPQTDPSVAATADKLSGGGDSARYSSHPPAADPRDGEGLESASKDHAEVGSPRATRSDASNRDRRVWCSFTREPQREKEIVAAATDQPPVQEEKEGQLGGRQ